MARTQYHVVPDGDGWKVEHGSTTKSRHSTKGEALDAGRSTAKANTPSQLIVHTSDGKIEDEFTYEGDPYPPAG